MHECNWNLNGLVCEMSWIGVFFQKIVLSLYSYYSNKGTAYSEVWFPENILCPYVCCCLIIENLKSLCHLKIKTDSYSKIFVFV